MKPLNILHLSTLLLTITSTISGQKWELSGRDTFGLFANEQVFEVTIQSDFKNLVKNKYQDNYQPAVLTYRINDSIQVRKAINIKARGEFRRGFCHFPPLKLNFEDTDFRQEDLQTLEKMKLVSPCKGGSTYQQYIFREYLLYKIYERYAQKSFRTRLVKITFIDTGRKDRVHTSYSFVIEEAKKMAARNGAALVRSKQLGQKMIDPQQMAKLVLFQYMIGNTDWSMTGQHNVKVMQELRVGGETTVVPYDFDYSGFVDTEYAIPHESLPISDVRQRLYLGFCPSEQDLAVAATFLKSRKGEVYKLINTFKYFSRREKADRIYYLDGFFKLLEKPKVLWHVIRRECK